MQEEKNQPVPQSTQIIPGPPRIPAAMLRSAHHEEAAAEARRVPDRERARWSESQADIVPMNLLGAVQPKEGNEGTFWRSPLS